MFVYVQFHIVWVHLALFTGYGINPIHPVPCLSTIGEQYSIGKDSISVAVDVATDLMDKKAYP